jgi:hypothetical protein
MADGPNCGVTVRHGIEYDYQRNPGGDSDNYYKESWTPQLVNSSFVAKVEWGDSTIFVLDMIGEHQRFGGNILRWNPEKHPIYPQLYCVGCELVRNLGELDYDPAHRNAMRYQEVEYLCTFAAFLYDVRSDADVAYSVSGPILNGRELGRYVVRKGKQTGEAIQYNGQFIYASAPQDAILTPPSLMAPYRVLDYVWHYVPGDVTGQLGGLITTADNLYGTVNNAIFDPSQTFTGYPIGTLMYLGMDYEPIPSTPAGNRLWTVTHHFAYRPYTWNAVYRPRAAGNTNGDWDGVVNKDSGNPPYASSNFMTLWNL